ncbi:MAG: CidA/LrgA family protein [Gemmiger sp.]
MRYVFQLLRILAFCLSGELLHWLLPLPVPASIYGLLLLLLALKTSVVKLDQVKETCRFLTSIFPLLFIPGAVGVMELWNVLGQIWLPVLLVLVPTTIAVFAASGHVTQWMIRRKRHE